MEELFPGHFRKSSEKIKAVWKECLFSVDANVLLNLYRYSPSTSKSFLGVLEKLKARLWLPWQAAHEFHRNRLGVIDKQTRTYEAASDSCKKLQSLLENPREHPFIDAGLLTRVTQTVSELISELDAKRNTRRKLLVQDPTLDLIASVFRGRVGAEPADELREKRLVAAKLRCEQKIPPGFRDVGKEGERPYGDTLMWLELMDHATQIKKPLVFVTDDAKSDWWLEMSGQVVGPQPALVHEFAKKTGQEILLYRPDRFAEHASTHLSSAIDQEVIEEIRSQTEERMRRRRPRQAPESLTDKRLWMDWVHLWSHRSDARQLVRAVNRLPRAEWQLHRTAMDIPLEVRTEVDECLKRCRCLPEIVSGIHQAGDSDFRKQLTELRPHLAEDEMAILGEMRDLPASAVEAIRSYERSPRG